MEKYKMDQDKIFQLCCAIIPGMMARYTKEEKSDARLLLIPCY